jgi:hypothetical protein
MNSRTNRPNDARTSQIRGKQFVDLSEPCIITKVRADVAARPIDFATIVEAIDAELAALGLAYAVERDALLGARRQALETALKQKHAEEERLAAQRARAVASVRRAEAEIYTAAFCGDPSLGRAGRVPGCEDDLLPSGRERGDFGLAKPKKVSLPRVAFLEAAR